jgi:DNA-binding NarL/FixJ family response regulator
MPTIRTLVVDDSPLFLLSILQFLATAPHLEVVGSACSGREAIEQVKHLRPDLVLMDVEMPEMSGLTATRHLKAQADAPCVIMLTFHGTPECRAVAMGLGADGFVSKLECDTELLPMIESLFARQSSTDRQAPQPAEGGLT